MNSLSLSIVNNVINFLTTMVNKLGIDLIFIVGVAVEFLFVLFFLFKTGSSYEVSLNRALDKLNYWLFQKKHVTENNIRELNVLFKTKAPKRLTYYWHQYVLFREGAPSSYFSTDNLIEKPTKTSTYKSDIKKLTWFTATWVGIIAAASLLFQLLEGTPITAYAVVTAFLMGLVVFLIGGIFVLFMNARRNSVLNSLYQNVNLFDRFMDNACVELPSYIDYQILFTPTEIEKGQPVLREFLDFKARKEKEEFNKAKEEQVEYITYDFSSTGVDGSIVLERAMRESELFLKRKEKLLVQISQLEAELESRKKNFDNVQRDSQTKIQASKENIQRLRQMQEETTNRIESNYYRKQQTQEAAKQEQLEQEFEQQRAKYLLEKGECEEEIKKLNEELEKYRAGVEQAMLNEYKTFFDKFCHSAEKVVAKVFDEKMANMKAEKEQDQQKLIELELKLKNRPEGGEAAVPQGQYDAEGNYVYADGTFYDKDGNFHDAEGNVYNQEGQLLEKAAKKEDKQFIDLDELDAFEFMTDVSQKDDIYDVAENVVKDVDKDNDIDLINSGKNTAPAEEEHEEKAPVKAEFEDFSLEKEKEEPKHEEPAPEPAPEVEEEPEEEPAEEPEEEEDFEEEEVEPEEDYIEEKPRRKAGRPRKIVKEEEVPVKKVGRPRKTPAPAEPKKKVGRPRKVAAPVVETKKKVGRPKKVTKVASVQARKPGRPKKQAQPAAPTKKVGRPRKVTQPAPKPVIEKKKPVGRPKKVTPKAEEKRGRGRPKKETLNEINRRLSEEESKLAQMRKLLNRELQDAMSDVETNKVDKSQNRRNQIMKEIDKLQAEAQKAMRTNQSQEKMAEINEKLEKLLNEIKLLS